MNIKNKECYNGPITVYISDIPVQDHGIPELMEA